MYYLYVYLYNTHAFALYYTFTIPCKVHCEHQFEAKDINKSLWHGSFKFMWCFCNFHRQLLIKSVSIRICSCSVPCENYGLALLSVFFSSFPFFPDPSPPFLFLSPCSIIEYELQVIEQASKLPSKHRMVVFFLYFFFLTE